MQTEKQELIEKFILQIHSELELCDGEKTPLICYNYNEQELKESLVQTIMETVLSRKISISEAIVEVERLYGNNFID